MAAKPWNTQQNTEHWLTQEITQRNLYWSLLNSLIVLQEHVIVEAILDGGTIAETAPVHPLHGFTQDVGAGVPVNLNMSGWLEKWRDSLYHCVYVSTCIRIIHRATGFVENMLLMSFECWHNTRDVKKSAKHADET